MINEAAYEIHVHGDVKLRAEVDFAALQEALRPLWKYAGAKSLTDGAQSLYEEEPGIHFDASERILHICWTVPGNDDFRQKLDDLCMNLNELSEEGAPLEIAFYDACLDESAPDEERDLQDDFLILFVGPTPAAIMQAQRDLLINDVVQLMERHFDGSELSGVVSEIDLLFQKRFERLTSSLDLSIYPRSPSSSHGTNRRPKHLH